MRVHTVSKRAFHLAVVFLLASCGNEPSKNPVEIFNESYNQRNHEGIRAVLSPDLKVTDYTGTVVNNTRESYFAGAITYTEPFGTKWTILEMRQEGNKIFTHEADSGSLNDFLYGKPLEFLYEYTIEKDKIVELKYDSLPGFSELEAKAMTKFNQLVEWIAKKHPEKAEIAQQSTREGARALNSLLREYLRGPK